MILGELIEAGERVAYSTQEHAVAHETRMKLSPEHRARTVHIHSPLIKVGDEAVCQRADEVKERVFEFGVSLMGSICPRCPFREECDAYAEAKDRSARVAEASAVFVSHAGISQVFGVDHDGNVKGADTLLIVDEMPGAFEQVEVPRWMLEKLAEGALMPSVDLYVVKTVQEICRAWLAGEEPGDVRWGIGGRVYGNAAELAKEWGRLALREGASPSPVERPLLQAADSVLRLAARAASGEYVEGVGTRAASGVVGMLPDACHEALVQRNGVLLSATPLMAALPGFALRQKAVLDGAPVRRVMVLRRDRGSKALTQNYYDDFDGRRKRRDKEPGEEPGIPWPEVEEALERACREADKIEPGSRVLFVTFKTVADALRVDGDRLRDGRIQVGHFGALRGKNDWQETAAREVSVVYCFGTPRFDIQSTLIQLGLVGEAMDQAWIAYAAGELTQAEGRLRLPRRTKPCTVVVEGDVAPLSWHSENVDDVITARLDTELPSSLLEGALLWRTQVEVAEALDVARTTVPRWRQPGRPPPSAQHLPKLRELAYPSIKEAMRLFTSTTYERLLAVFKNFVWEVDLE